MIELAQDALIEKASEGFEKWFKSQGLNEILNESDLRMCEDAWQAAKLSCAKEIELKDSWVKHHQEWREHALEARLKDAEEVIRFYSEGKSDLEPRPDKAHLYDEDYPMSHPRWRQRSMQSKHK